MAHRSRPVEGSRKWLRLVGFGLASAVAAGIGGLGVANTAGKVPAPGPAQLGPAVVAFRSRVDGALCVDRDLRMAGLDPGRLLFGRVSRLAAWLLLPCWAWVSFATALNLSIALMN